MTLVRPWLITAALLSAPLSSGLAAEPLEGVDAARASASMIQGQAASARLGVTDVVLASHVVQPRQRMEIGLGLSNDAPINHSMAWYDVYLQGLNQVNTLYGLPRETPRPGFNNSTAPSAFCCRSSNTPIALDQFAGTVTAQQIPPAFYLFGMLRKKGLNINLADEWKLVAGVRPMQYSTELQTKIRFVSVERYWKSFRTSYSYELERFNGVSAAPSQVVRFDYLYGAHDSIGVSFANGREVAYFGSLGILNTEVHSVALRGQHLFKQDWALTYQAGYNDHGSLPAQAAVRIGVQRSF